MKHETPTLEQCEEIYQQLWKHYNTSLEELIAFLLRSPAAQIMAGVKEGQLPENAPRFELDDIQKEHYKKAERLYEKLKTQMEAQQQEADDEYNQLMEEQAEEERQKAKSRRLEYFTKNDDLIKLTLPPETLATVFSNIEKNATYCPEFEERELIEKKDEIRDKLHDEIYKGYEKYMNELFAAVILPYFTNVLSNQCRYEFIQLADEQGNKEHKLAMTEVPYLLSDYNYVNDVLKEYNGLIFENPDKNPDYGVFEDTLFDFIFDYTENFIYETFFNVLNNDFSITIADDRKEDVFTAITTYVFPYNYISELTQDYIEIIKNLTIKELFDLYNIKDQLENYEFCLLDEKDFNDEKEQIAQFIQSLKNATAKEITMFDGQVKYNFYIDSNDNLLNDNGEDVEQDVKNLLWEIGIDLVQSTTLFVHEHTSIKNQNDEPQKKVYGILIQNGMFCAITKESLKDVFQQLEAPEHERNYRYFDWSFGFLPDFSVDEENGGE